MNFLTVQLLTVNYYFYIPIIFTSFFMFIIQVALKISTIVEMVLERFKSVMIKGRLVYQAEQYLMVGSFYK